MLVLLIVYEGGSSEGLRDILVGAHLSWLRDRFHFWHQDERESMSVWSRDESLNLVIDFRNLVSSANRWEEECAIVLGRSCMYIRNRIGPSYRMLPWGTPDCTRRRWDESPQRLVDVMRPVAEVLLKPEPQGSCDA